MMRHPPSSTLFPYPTLVGSATAADTAWEQSAARLAAARVVIDGHPALTAALHAELGATLQTGTDTDNATLVVLATAGELPVRSEEHTPELQSQSNIACRLLP